MLGRTALVRFPNAWRIVLWFFVWPLYSNHREAHYRHVETNHTVILVILIDVSNSPAGVLHH
jgi:hypothetical protein